MPVHDHATGYVTIFHQAKRDELAELEQQPSEQSTVRQTLQLMLDLEASYRARVAANHGWLGKWKPEPVVTRSVTDFSVTGGEVTLQYKIRYDDGSYSYVQFML